jgi:predicted membrane-bound spermidine synthase
MELLNPRITVQNTDADFWLVTVEHRFTADESVVLTVRIPRNDSIAAVQASALRRAQSLLSKLSPC